MDDGTNFDLKNLDALRRELKDLRARARKGGVLGSQTDAGAGLGLRRRAAVQPAEPEARGKQLAGRLLGLLRRGEDDRSPAVPGTDFTEVGVERLLTRLARPGRRAGPAEQFLQNLYRHLTAPVPRGTPTVSDVSKDKLLHLSRLLVQIEKHGWDQVKSRGRLIHERPSADDAEPVAAAAKNVTRTGRRRRG